jgi:uroporphyrinogen-III synthase
VSVPLPDLDGFTIGVTADRRSDEQIELLRRRGAQVVHGPTIRTLPLDAEEALRSATEQVIVRPPDVVIANTGIGMRNWFGAADSWGIGDALLGALREATILSRGPKASGAVYQAGLPVSARADSERLSEVVALAVESGVDGKRVAFQRHGDEAPEVLDRLRDAGAIVVEVPVYAWKVPDDHRPVLRLIAAAIEGRLHAITFTSAPAIRNLTAIATEHELTDALIDACNRRVAVCCVGPVCAAAAVDEGFTDPVVPDKARLGPMILALSEHLAATQRRFDAGGRDVVVRGSVVLVDGEPAALSEREAQLLAALVREPGQVVDKASLLRIVWGDDAVDTHLVETTMARLRRRLGDLGDSVVAIPRRGYRFTGVEVLEEAS